VVPGVLPELLVKLPPAVPSVQIAEVAPPPKEPPKAPVVPPWQIAGIVAPAFTVGLGFTVKVLVALALPQDPPEVVSVNMMDAIAEADAV
jgi:hypothetical protein